MSRIRLNRALTIILVIAVVFAFTSCGKLSPRRLRANYYFSQANNNFSENLFRQAIEGYEKALEFNPDLNQAYRYLGESYKSLYKPGVDNEKNKELETKALEILRRAFEIDPSSKEVIFSLGDMYDKMNNFEEAEKLYMRILDMEPTNMDNYYVVAEFYKRYSMVSDVKKEGEDDKQGEQGEKTEEAEGVKTPHQKAEEMYLRRIETDPDNPQGYAYIAKFYEDLTPIPEFDKACFFHQKRVDLEPENPEAWLAVGINRWAKSYRLQNLPKRERLGIARESEVALKKANELDSSYPEPYSWLSVLYSSVLIKLDPDRAKRYEEDADRFADRFKDLRKRQLERKRLERELTQEIH